MMDEIPVFMNESYQEYSWWNASVEHTEGQVCILECCPPCPECPIPWMDFLLVFLFGMCIGVVLLYLLNKIKEGEMNHE